MCIRDRTCRVCSVSIASSLPLSTSISTRLHPLPVPARQPLPALLQGSPRPRVRAVHGAARGFVPVRLAGPHRARVGPAHKRVPGTATRASTIAATAVCAAQTHAAGRKDPRRARSGRVCSQQWKNPCHACYASSAHVIRLRSLVLLAPLFCPA